MKDFSSSIGKRTVFTVHNNNASIVQHASNGMQTIYLPITSLLQAVSSYIQNDVGNSELENDCLVLATPYINRAIQHGASVLTGIPNADVDATMKTLEHHPMAAKLRYHVVQSSCVDRKDIVISLREPF